MEQGNENLYKLHKSLSDSFELPKWEQFEMDMQDEENLKKLHSSASQVFEIPEYDQFRVDMGFGGSPEGKPEILDGGGGVLSMPSEEEQKPLFSLGETTEPRDNYVEYTQEDKEASAPVYQTPEGTIETPNASYSAEALLSEKYQKPMPFRGDPSVRTEYGENIDFYYDPEGRAKLDTIKEKLESEINNNIGTPRAGQNKFLRDDLNEVEAQINEYDISHDDAMWGENFRYKVGEEGEEPRYVKRSEALKLSGDMGFLKNGGSIIVEPAVDGTDDVELKNRWLHNSSRVGVGGYMSDVATKFASTAIDVSAGAKSFPHYGIEFIARQVESAGKGFTGNERVGIVSDIADWAKGEYTTVYYGSSGWSPQAYRVMSENLRKRTLQSETTAVDYFAEGDFTNAAAEIVSSGIESAPYTLTAFIPVVGPYAIGVSVAANKRAEYAEEGYDDKKAMIGSALSGVGEYVSEKVTIGILKGGADSAARSFQRASARAAERGIKLAPAAAKTMVKTWGEYAKSFALKEMPSEMLASFNEDIMDGMVSGKSLSFEESLKKAVNEGLASVVMIGAGATKSTVALAYHTYGDLKLASSVERVKAKRYHDMLKNARPDQVEVIKSLNEEQREVLTRHKKVIDKLSPDELMQAAELEQKITRLTDELARSEESAREQYEELVKQEQEKLDAILKPYESEVVKDMEVIQEQDDGSRLMTPKSEEDAVLVMKELFGLDEQEAKATAKVYGFAVKNMAERAGITTEEMWDNIAFSDSDAPSNALYQKSSSVYDTDAASRHIDKLAKKSDKRTPTDWVKRLLSSDPSVAMQITHFGIKEALENMAKSLGKKSLSSSEVKSVFNKVKLEPVDEIRAGRGAIYMKFGGVKTDIYHPDLRDAFMRQGGAPRSAKDLYGKVFRQLEEDSPFYNDDLSVEHYIYGNSVIARVLRDGVVIKQEEIYAGISKEEAEHGLQNILNSGIDIPASVYADGIGIMQYIYPIANDGLKADDIIEMQSQKGTSYKSTLLGGGTPVAYREFLMKIPGIRSLLNDDSDKYVELAIDEYVKSVQDVFSDILDVKISRSEALDLLNKNEPGLVELEGKLQSKNIPQDVVSKAAGLVNRYAEGYNNVLTGINFNQTPAEKSAMQNHWGTSEDVSKHVRMSVREDVDGNEYLHIDEIQSDWAQAARSIGVNVTEVDDIRGAKDPNNDGVGLVIKRDDYKFDYFYRIKSNSFLPGDPSADEYKDVFIGTFNSPDIKNLSASEKVRLLRVHNEITVPTTPYKDSNKFTQFAIRRILRYAADNNINRVSFADPSHAMAGVFMPKDAAEAFYGGIVPMAIKATLKRYGVNQPMKRAEFSHKTKPVTINEDFREFNFYAEHKLDSTYGSKLIKIESSGITSDNAIEIEVARSKSGDYVIVDVKASRQGLLDYASSTLKSRIVNRALQHLTPSQMKDEETYINFIESQIESLYVYEFGIIGANYIEMSDNLKQSAKRPVPLYQQQEDGVPAGAMVAEDGKYIIFALTDPNVSTPLHELAHVYEHYLTDEERKQIMEWAGTDEWTVETSEKFARGFEKFLSDGNVENQALKKAFENFKKWLLDIYNGITGSDIDIKLNDNMQDIYNRMVSDSQVEAEPEVQVGDKVTYKKDGKQRTGTATEVGEDTVTIIDSDNIDAEYPKSEVNVKKKPKTPIQRKIEKVAKGEKPEKKITMPEKAALHKQIRDFIRGRREAAKDQKAISKIVNELLKNLSGATKLTANQARSLARAAASINFANPSSVERFIKKFDTIIAMNDRAARKARIEETKRRQKKAYKRASKGDFGINGHKARVLFTLDAELIPDDMLDEYEDMLDKFVGDVISKNEDIAATIQEAQELFSKIEQELGIEDAVEDYENEEKVAERKRTRSKAIETKKANILNRLKNGFKVGDTIDHEDEILSELNDITKEDLDALSDKEIDMLDRVTRGLEIGLINHQSDVIANVIMANRAEANVAKSLVSKHKNIVRKLLEFKRAFNSKKIKEILRNTSLTNLDSALGIEGTALSDVGRYFNEKYAAFEMEVKDILDEMGGLYEKFKGSKSAEDADVKVMMVLLDRHYKANPNNKKVFSVDDLVKEVTVTAVSQKILERFGERRMEVILGMYEKYRRNGAFDGEAMYKDMSEAEKSLVRFGEKVFAKGAQKLFASKNLVRGESTESLEKYVHYRTIEHSESEIGIDSIIESILSGQPNTSTKAGVFEERTGKIPSISFSFHDAMSAYARQSNLDYHLTRALKRERLTLNKIKKKHRDSSTPESTMIAEALSDSYTGLRRHLLFNDYMKDLSNPILDLVKQAAYRYMLGHFSRFVREALSNFSYVSMEVMMDKNPGMFKEIMKNGLEYSTGGNTDLFRHVPTTQPSRYRGRSKFAGYEDADVSTSIASYNPYSKSGQKKIAMGIEKLAKRSWSIGYTDFLIGSPDAFFSRGIFVTHLKHQFKELTGDDINLDKIAEGDKKYLSDNRRAIADATKVADRHVRLGFSTTNRAERSFAQLEAATEAKKGNPFQAMKYFMLPFMINEYESLRKQIVNNKGLSGVKYSVPIITRMMIYELMIQAMINTFLSFFPLGGDDEEMYIEKEQDGVRDVGRAFASGVISLLMGSMHQGKRAIAAAVVEGFNYLLLEGVTRPLGEKYNPYDHSIMYTKLGIREGAKSNEGYKGALYTVIPYAQPITEPIIDLAAQTGSLAMGYVNEDIYDLGLITTEEYLKRMIDDQTKAIEDESGLTLMETGKPPEYYTLKNLMQLGAALNLLPGLREARDAYTYYNNRRTMMYKSIEQVEEERMRREDLEKRR
jgi:hypothetical protein